MADDNELTYKIVHTSGLTIDDNVSLGYRYRDEEAFRSDEVESWLFYTRADSFSSVCSWPTFINGLWQSPAGRIYVTSADGELVIGEIDRDKRVYKLISQEDAGCALTSIWGLDDQHVYAFGGAPDRPGKIRFFDGKTWTKLPDAPAWLLHMHGCAPDCIYGVGQKTVFRWDGHAWHQTGLRAASSLASVWVQEPDEIYVTDQGGVLFDGSSSGFVERARWNGPLDGVAKFAGELWLGGEQAGLLKLDGKTNKIEVIKPKVLTRAIEARKELLIAAEDRVVYSADGESFRSVGSGAFPKFCAKRPFRAGPA